ncbi:MAG TPA: Gfo/Idh/MocA family oxidoreductase [Bryobacteraceae bacterium]|jgi:predicted dehydrogenase|nr:Gfo/Idh/MocA family oxidoreductase [Bryobacteraceae bacterium]
MEISFDFDLNHSAPQAVRRDFGIGAVGAGFIMRDVQIPAYLDAGFHVAGITSRTPEIAREAADLRGLARVYDTLDQMLDDPAIEILDIAVPPDRQLAIIEQALSRKSNLKGILAQKPLAVNYGDAVRIVELCEKHRMPLAVNQNMRYDQSMRALKTLLERGVLGEPVLATIEMRAVPHWQAWLREYGRLTLLNMSIHHIDSFEYLFGAPESIYVSVRKDPRTHFAHTDGICLYILEYENGLRASGWDDVWAGPRTNAYDMQPYIKWRVEGTKGLAQGTIGWPEYPNRAPSTITFMSTDFGGAWITPRWKEVWFPDAFAGPMASLMNAIACNREPQPSGRENLVTMAVVEAGYRSMQEKRAVRISEIR